MTEGPTDNLSGGVKTCSTQTSFVIIIRDETASRIMFASVTHDIFFDCVLVYIG